MLGPMDGPPVKKSRYSLGCSLGRAAHGETRRRPACPSGDYKGSSTQKRLMSTRLTLKDP